MNLVYDLLSRHIPGAKRKGGSNWMSFNAICCTYNGEPRPDTRNRGGLMLTPENVCVYHCFNCHYKASWSPGKKLYRKMETLLDLANIGQMEIKKLKFKVWQLEESAKADAQFDPMSYAPTSHLRFKAEELPKGAMPFSYWLKPENFREEFAGIAEYVMNRGLDIFNAYEYYWTPEVTEDYYDMNKRVIIPFRWEDKIVGFMGRDTTNTLKHRYYGSVQPHYMFNTESIEYDNEFIFLCEGSFDALAIGGVAMLGDKVTPEQAEWLNNTGKKIVVVPDREKLGGKLVDTALQYGWYVSFPEWGSDLKIKDAAQAVQELGKIYTMLSITGAMINSKLAINTKRKLTLRVR